MTQLNDQIAALSEEDKTQALTDLTEVAFSLATTLRVLEVFAETAVEVGQATGSYDFTAVAGLLLSMRAEDGPLTVNAKLALDHPKVNDYILQTLVGEVDEEPIVQVIDLGEDADLQAIIDAIEAALDNGDVTLDALNKYL